MCIVKRTIGEQRIGFTGGIIYGRRLHPPYCKINPEKTMTVTYIPEVQEWGSLKEKNVSEHNKFREDEGSLKPSGQQISGIISL